jgi:hypothetical protein
MTTPLAEKKPSRPPLAEKPRSFLGHKNANSKVVIIQVMMPKSNRTGEYRKNPVF